MSLLAAGVILWSITHLFPAIAPARRDRFIARLGRQPYRGLFSLVIVASLVMIVIGWQRTALAAVYVPPLYGSLVVPLLLFVAFFLLAASHAPGNTKRWLRHPMLTGTVVWAVAHLLANGENRSVVLFGGIGLWAFVAIVLINRRDGAWQKPAPVPASRDLMTLVAAVAVFAIVAYVHPWLFGVSPWPALR